MENKFEIYGHTFTAGRVIEQEERDRILHSVTSIGISNYDGGKYNYNEFYLAAQSAGIYEYDIFIMDGKGEVIPCGNELFAINKEEADKILPKKKTLYRTTIQVVVIGEHKYDETDLDQIAYDITNGDYTGNVDVRQIETLIGKDAVDAVKKVGTALEFFQMDENGNEIED